MVRPNAMIAIKLTEGMAFGRVRKVSVSRILFEMESELMLGQQLEWRMELTGWNATVLGRLQVRRIQTRDDRPDLVEARIVHIDGTEARLFQDWLTELSVGGTTRRYEYDPSSVHGLKASRMSGSSKAQTQHVLNKMDNRGQDRGNKTENPSDAFGLTSQLSSAISGIEEGGSGRKAMSDALKSSLMSGGQRRRNMRPSEAQPPLPERRRSSSPQTSPPQGPDGSAVSSLGRPSRSQAPSWLQDSQTPVTRGPPSTGPMTPKRSSSTSSSMTVPGPVIDLKTRPHGRIRVEYKDPSSFHHDWLKHIRRSGLFIREQLSEPVGSEREIELILPSGKTLNCTAQIVAPMPSGTGLALQLKPSQLRELEYEAQRSQPS